MKKPYEWTEEDLISLVNNEVQESIDLDYKECMSLRKKDREKKEIGKDVSAFANSAGGTIVYGIREQGHIPISIDSGFNQNEISKEWLEQVINSNIQPKIEGIRINPVELSTSNPGKFVYVVCIPQALSRAPHQASDKKYYKRYNFESTPMEDYEIRDLYTRQSTPDLYLTFSLTRNSLGIDKLDNEIPFDEDNGLGQEIEIFTSIGNTSNQPAECCSINIYFFSEIKFVSAPGFQSNSLELNNDHRMHCIYKNLLPSLHMPIFKQRSYSLTTTPIKVIIKTKEFHQAILWRVDTPRSESKYGVVSFEVSKNKLKLIREDAQDFFDKVLEELKSASQQK